MAAVGGSSIKSPVKVPESPSGEPRLAAEGGVHAETPYVDAPFEIDYEKVPPNGKVALLTVRNQSVESFAFYHGH